MRTVGELAASKQAHVNQSTTDERGKPTARKTRTRLGGQTLTLHAFDDARVDAPRTETPYLIVLSEGDRSVAAACVWSETSYTSDHCVTTTTRVLEVSRHEVAATCTDDDAVMEEYTDVALDCPLQFAVVVDELQRCCSSVARTDASSASVAATSSSLSSAAAVAPPSGARFLFTLPWDKLMELHDLLREHATWNPHSARTMLSACIANEAYRRMAEIHRQCVASVAYNRCMSAYVEEALVEMLAQGHVVALKTSNITILRAERPLLSDLVTNLNVLAKMEFTYPAVCGDSSDDPEPTADAVTGSHTVTDCDAAIAQAMQDRAEEEAEAEEEEDEETDVEEENARPLACSPNRFQVCFRRLVQTALDIVAAKKGKNGRCERTKLFRRGLQAVLTDSLHSERAVTSSLLDAYSRWVLPEEDDLTVSNALVAMHRALIEKAPRVTATPACAGAVTTASTAGCVSKATASPSVMPVVSLDSTDLAGSIDGGARGGGSGASECASAAHQKLGDCTRAPIRIVRPHGVARDHGNAKHDGNVPCTAACSDAHPKAEGSDIIQASVSLVWIRGSALDQQIRLAHEHVPEVQLATDAEVALFTSILASGTCVRAVAEQHPSMETTCGVLREACRLQLVAWIPELLALATCQWLQRCLQGVLLCRLTPGGKTDIERFIAATLPDPQPLFGAVLTQPSDAYGPVGIHAPAVRDWLVGAMRVGVGTAQRAST